MSGVDVRGRLFRAPWWVLSLVMGTIFGLSQFAFRLIDGHSVAASAGGAAVGGVFFGLIVGPILRRSHGRYRAAVGELPPDQERKARRAARRGPVPADPEVRQAAIRVADHQIDAYRRTRWAPAFWLFMIALSVWLAVSDSGWWVLGALLFTGFLIVHLWAPRRLNNRRLMLAGEI